MATYIGITKSASTEYGVNASHGVIISANLDAINRRVVIMVAGYYDQTAYSSGKTSMVLKDEICDDTDFDTYIGEAAIGSLDYLEACYLFLANSTSSGYYGGTLLT